MKPILLVILACCYASVGLGEEAPQTAARAYESARNMGLSADKELMRSLDALKGQANRALVPAIRRAENIEVFSLMPGSRKEFPKGEANFHGYKIKGSIVIPAGERAQKLKDSLITGIIPASMLACYAPRHGVRFTSKAGVVDLEICFECGKAGAHGLPEGKDVEDLSFINEQTLDLLNQILDEAGIPRDEPKKGKKRTPQ